MGQTESVLDRLKGIVTDYEVFGKGIQQKPTQDQIYENFWHEKNFKKVYAEAISGTTANSQAEDLLTRFKRVQLHINKLVSPATYNYEQIGSA